MKVDFKKREGKHIFDIILSECENKRITILESKNNTKVVLRDGVTLIRNYNKERGYLSIHCLESCVIEIIPSVLKKTKVFCEDINSEKLNKILKSKYKRCNN